MKPSASAKPGEKTAAKPVKKQNLLVPPRASSLTAMVLKYPRTVTLPSIPGLKAKLAWFGPLVEGGTRVRWTSYTCQVIFQHKPDAQTAAMYVNNNEHLLGRNVQCSLFEVDPATLEPLPNPGKPRPPASSPRPGKDGAGSGGSLTPPRALPHRQPPAPTAPLKSILKKPGSISAARPPSSLPPPPPPPLRSSLSSSAPPPPSPPPLPLHSSLSSPTPAPPPPPPLPFHSSLSSPTPPIYTSAAPFLSLITYSNSTSAAAAAAPFLSLIIYSTSTPAAATFLSLIIYPTSTSAAAAAATFLPLIIYSASASTSTSTGCQPGSAISTSSSSYGRWARTPWACAGRAEPAGAPAKQPAI